MINNNKNFNPFVKNLYTILSKDENKVVVKLSDATHPIFKAHFPTNAILPGFVNFEIISEAFDMEITSIKKAKFLKPALPEQELTYEKNANKFKVFCQNQEIASFTL